MDRLVAAALVGLLGTAVARADLLPPGTRNLAVEHTIETDKELPGWEFFVVQGSGGVKAAKLDPKNPLVIPGSAGVGRGPAPQPGEKPRLIPYRSNLLVAVPKGARKQYDAEKDFHAAIEDGKVTGMVRVKDAFSDHENVKANDPRKSVTRRFKVAKIDEKDGIVLEAIKDDPPGKQEEEEAATRPASVWVAALAATAGLVLGGFWLTGRNRRGRELGT